MYSVTQKELLSECFGTVNFTVYADFNCPFCYALNERIFAMDLDHTVDFRLIQHAPETHSKRGSLELLSELTIEVAEVRRRLPATEINIPTLRPNSAAATSLVYAIGRDDPVEAARLRRAIYRALWVDGQDISNPDILAFVLLELDIELPLQRNLSNDELNAWQSEWANNAEFDRNLPVVISQSGETVIGFLFQPELDAFLESGSMVSDKVVDDIWQPQKRQRILVLDNDAQSLRMIVEQMHDAQVEVVEDFIGLIANARNLGMPDLLMVNASFIENVSGSDWWRNVTNSDPSPATPIIHILDEQTPEAEAAAFETGAADVIAKPFHPKLLRSRINSHLQAHRSQQKIIKNSQLDALTSIGNQREFDSKLSREWSRNARAGTSLAMLMIDVDKLRAFNDTYGHFQGDDCLVTVAQELSNCVRRCEDLVARYKGGLFTVLLPGVDVEGALIVAQDCVQAILDARIPHPASSVAPHVTLSIGATAMLPIHGTSHTLIIEQAENALYQAKQNYSNAVCVFDQKSCFPI